MSNYDVAIVGYGPTGVTAANLLGAQGLRVAVVERDASVYARARAISTDEEVLRIWQQVGLAEDLVRDMLPDRPIHFVDRRGTPFIDACFTLAGHGYPPQLFLYQPALEETLRAGVDRSPNVDLLLSHECLRVRQDNDDVELLLVEGEQLKRIRASWVIAADGGSSPIRGQLGIGFDGRTYETRWASSTPRSTGSGPVMTCCGSTATPAAPRSTARRRWAITGGSSRCCRARTSRNW